MTDTSNTPSTSTPNEPLNEAPVETAASTTDLRNEPREQRRGGRERNPNRDRGARGSNIEFALGFSHPVLVEPPAGITFTVEGNNRLTVSGIDKQAVGETAANIRKIRKPEPYKGKGVRYAGENVRRKAGKSGK